MNEQGSHSLQSQIQKYNKHCPFPCPNTRTRKPHSIIRPFVYFLPVSFKCFMVYFDTIINIMQMFTPLWVSCFYLCKHDYNKWCEIVNGCLITQPWKATICLLQNMNFESAYFIHRVLYNSYKLLKLHCNSDCKRLKDFVINV